VASLSEAVAAHRSGKSDQAEALYRAILRRERLNFDANNLLGTLLCQQQRFDEGLTLLQRAVKARPGSTAAQLNLGHALAGLNRFAEAETHYRRALDAAPEQAQALRALCRVLVRQERAGEALALSEAALQKAPQSAELRAEHGELLAALGRDGEAIEALRAALALKPALAPARRRLAILLAHDGNYLDTLPVLETFPDDPDCLIALAKAYRQAQMPAAALAAGERALQLAPERSDAQVLMATLSADGGGRAKACKQFRAILATGRSATDALYGLALAGAIEPDSPEGQKLAALAASPPDNAGERRLVHFACGQMLDRAGAPAAAFAQYRLAHAAGAGRFDLDQYVRFVDAQIAGFDSRLVRELAQQGSESSQPVFIVGLPRSGTSLIEQIIASHPDAAGAGELEEMRALARGAGFSIARPAVFAETLAKKQGQTAGAAARTYLQALARRGHTALRVTDKMPHNFEVLGFIAAVFPQARLIHCRRDAADTCLSIYTQNFGRAHAYADDLETLGGYYRQYRRLMDHWHDVLGERLMSIDYEALVASPAAETQRLLAHAGLAFDARCLAFHTSDRAVTTFSQHQVRQPLYASSIGRWRRYGEQVLPLLQALGPYAPH
jgi:Tfp pilus assembly protein PilF